MRIAVAGGTGTVGRHVVTAVAAAGHDPVVLSRSAGVDLVSGDGLAARLAGVRAVIDVSSTPSLSTRGAVRFFRAVTANLLAAERAAGIPHHVALSIIGAPAANSGHYAGKAVQEDLVGNSGGGWSLLRTTQFHEFARQSAERGSVAGLCLVPAMRCQPVAAAEVAAELVRVAAGAPRGLAPDLAGPREESLPELVRRYLRAAGSRHPVLRVSLPGPLGRAMRDGSLLPASGARLAGVTFDQWLAAQFPADQRPARQGSEPAADRV
jgi:uncharacterized protein YbjT (DUF2867 family)